MPPISRRRVRLEEGKQRAIRRIGEISKGLEKAEGFKGNQHEVLPSAGTKLKSATLKAAGISTSAANRAEAIADLTEAANGGRALSPRN